MENDIKSTAGEANVEFIEAQDLATNLMGDSIMTNLFMVGYATKRAYSLIVWVYPWSHRLNGVSVTENTLAFNWGRLAAVDLLLTVQGFAHKDKPIDPDHHLSESVGETIERRTRFLEDYQNRSYADIYHTAIEKVGPWGRSCGSSHSWLLSIDGL